MESTSDAIAPRPSPAPGDPAEPHVAPFDDEALRAAEQATTAMHRSVCRDQQNDPSHAPEYISFVELCCAQGELNSDAAMPPHNGIPIELVVCDSEELRACMIGLLNLAIFHGGIPPSWCLIPVVPVLKPGKTGSDISNYRPISLLAAMAKLFDRLLFKRIKIIMGHRLGEWQGGGCQGADTWA